GQRAPAGGRDRVGSVALATEPTTAGTRSVRRRAARLRAVQPGRRGSWPGRRRLGLAIVKTVAETSGGTAHIANRPEGGVDVWLSLARPSMVVERVSRERLARRKGPRKGREGFGQRAAVTISTSLTSAQRR